MSWVEIRLSTKQRRAKTATHVRFFGRRNRHSSLTVPPQESP
jgi:hypothetical protein